MKQSCHPEDVCLSRDMDVGKGWVGCCVYHHESQCLLALVEDQEEMGNKDRLCFSWGKQQPGTGYERSSSQAFGQDSEHWYRTSTMGSH